MKLVNKIVLLYLLVTLVVFAAGGVITYNIFKNTIDVEQKWQLRHQYRLVKESLEQGKEPNLLNAEKLQVRKLYNDTTEVPVYFTDTLVKHPRFDYLEPNIMLKTKVMIDSQLYYVSLFDMMVESEDITEGVSDSMFKIYLLLLAVVVLSTFFLSNLLFKPFNHTLEKIRSFRLDDHEVLKLDKTSTKEFARLNGFLMSMTDKMKKDYFSLKEFSENASHEFLTPLAIIKGKLELLINSPNIKNEEIRLIQSAQQSVGQLSRLSQSLTLLTRIENKEFSNTKQVNFSKILRQRIYDFNELMSFKKLDVQTEIEDDVYVRMDPNLAEILLTNLFQNAIKHNVVSGKLMVKLNPSLFQISNSGKPPHIPTEEFFKRFKKGNQSEASIGLGLAIVKKICEVNYFQINYQFVDNHHIISIGF